MLRYKNSMHTFFKNLEKAEDYLRRRRQFEEADSVNFAKSVLLEEAYEIMNEEKGKKNVENS